MVAVLPELNSHRSVGTGEQSSGSCRKQKHWYSPCGIVHHSAGSGGVMSKGKHV